MTFEVPPQVRGVIVGDMMETLQIGDVLTKEHFRFVNSDASSIPQQVANWDVCDGSIVSISLRETEAPTSAILGSAVMIAPCLAITATHVIEHFEDRLRGGQATGFCTGIRPDGLEIWGFRTLTYDSTHDIALISLQLLTQPRQPTFRTIPVSRRAPEKGEILTILGFRFPDPMTHEGSDGQAVGDLMAASGPVTQLFPEGRDLVLAPYPAIEIGCGSLGGMSGGAVFDSQGLLIGVISRGLLTDENSGPTLASWIGSFDAEVEVPWPSGLYPESVPFSKIDPRLLTIVDTE